ncbi:toxin glutamine deamidase domain-containing protein [Micromonospora carbonacea]|uniref:Papain fold toxin 1, glutamine deamidase n=1 Tax=Micromonospora carbonacea TaxID=47853 RepID=A0A1C5A3S0_9ACTN|nr:toxin glutamine deamidase domain-containing protein [Micromonospora carbonacea]SCF39799.1 Papain fold toxin 1, glutamine deamidase [Micromonospora carbonacea]
MTLLPSPIPHPLDYSPWELPGWVYEALDWVIGVEWPEGDEKAVWDLADQWYAVADALAGPRADAVAAAGEVRSGYGGVGAVAEAFDAAWRRVAEGDEAPLPVLLAVSGDLGRLVEGCGCDIEGAKLEVWIELGILVVELLSLAVAAVLTAGAASPAAGAAIAASRFVVQQIFKKLLAQLARKTLKQGLKEAGERAAKRVAEGGMRGLARKAARGGLEEAAEESGITLATQAYQNSTGRRHGLDVTDAGMSALGGLAGGAAAPLAGLGRHATGRAARVGEHFGREMTGEVIADQAANVATGQGLVSLEDAARAAASGATGSTTAQTDTALHHRLDGRMAALAGASFAPTDLGGPAPAPTDATPVPTPTDGTPGAGPERPTVPLPRDGAGTGPVAPALGAAGPDLGPAEAAGDALRTHQQSSPPATPESPSGDAHSAGPAGGAHPGHGSTALAGAPTEPAAQSPGAPGATDGPVAPRATAAPTLSSVAPVEPGQLDTRGAGPPPPSVATASAATASGVAAATAPVASVAATVTDGGVPGGPAPHLPAPASGTVAPPPASAAPPAAGAGAVGVARPPAPGHDGPFPPPPPRFPLLHSLDPRSPSADHSVPPPRRSPEWQASRRAEREAYDRRRYQARFHQQRALHEDNRRYDDSQELRSRYEFFQRRASEYAAYALSLKHRGQDYLATSWHRMAVADERAAHESRELAEAVLAGTVTPQFVEVSDPLDFYSINTDDPSLVVGEVDTGGPSALTGDDHPPPIDRSRRYGQWGGLRPPLALHQSDLERAMPRDAGGQVLRTADPRRGGWFRLANDGGPAADPTRGINCLDCTLSLYETWMHGRPRVSAPRTFDAYAAGDISRPLGGELGGPGRVEDATGGRFQQLVDPDDGTPEDDRWSVVNRGFGSIERQLRAGGHGSYAFLITTYEGGGSHAWVALNQGGGVLYLDPQSGIVSDMPIYLHSGLPAPHNVTGIDALVLGADGRPMPFAGAGPGQFSQRAEVTEQWQRSQPEDRSREWQPGPDDPTDDELYVNRMHLLEGPGSAGPAPVDPSEAWLPTAVGPAALDGGEQADAHAVRHARDRARAPLQETGPPARAVLSEGRSLDQVLAAGVTPAEFAAESDASILQRLVPYLDERAAHVVARLLADVRIRTMLREAWDSPPRDEPLLAEALLKRLTQRPDLAGMILATPALANSLTARPMTFYDLAGHQQAIDVLGSVLDDIARRGPLAVAEEAPPPV